MDKLFEGWNSSFLVHLRSFIYLLFTQLLGGQKKHLDSWQYCPELPCPLMRALRNGEKIFLLIRISLLIFLREKSEKLPAICWQSSRLYF